MRNRMTTTGDDDEAEHDFRRMSARHYNLVSENKALQTDLQSWQLQAKVAEAEVERLTVRLAEAEARAERYSTALATLRGQWQAGVQIWVNGFDTLKALDLPQLHAVPPPQLTDGHE